MIRTYGTQSGVREVMLTFDDGPNPKTTPKVLDTLARHDIKAVFFVLGSLIGQPNGRAIIERVHREGHMLGNHSHSHANLRKLPEQKVKDEINKTHNLICECANGCRVFRPPFGETNAIVKKVARELGYEEMMWNVDTLDWKLKVNGAWVEHGMKQIKAREDSLVLMHDIHSTTADNLEDLIIRIKKIPNTKFVLYN